ncbi:hypothetical protein OIDMADRAFT_110503 [Oidiodendron maius Zn]|uniref:N-acetyltransferase domain-containing protein n=1 Tax=Oidiodendron maius (strain Zn) TaxID=913774 RepID=A0A0C3HG63_OIDMZ|nr:hypothetical protein OIDMADRAFT_110503 [Oidiodendron maius Zn]
MAKYAAETDRLWLQPLSVEDHLQDFHQIMSDKKAISFSYPPADILITKRFMLKFVPSLEKPWVENYAILLRASQNANENGEPRMIGTVGSTRLADEDAIEIAYGLHSDYWGKGYMVEALGMFIKLYWAVERTGVRNTLIAKIDPENVASWKVVEKLGFQKGEVLENAYQRGADSGSGKSERSQEKWCLERPKNG